MAQITGEPVEWLHDFGGLYVQIGLNQTDASAIHVNKGKAAPRMLTNVTAGRHRFPNAVIVHPGSILNLRLRYTGPWGFGCQIETGNTTIVRSSFAVSTEPDEEKVAVVRRYPDRAKTLRVDDWATLGIDSAEQKAARWRLDFLAWDILGFYRDGRRYGTPSRPGDDTPWLRAARAPSSGAGRATEIGAGRALEIGAARATEIGAARATEPRAAKTPEPRAARAPRSVGAPPSMSIEVRGGGFREGGDSGAKFESITRLNLRNPDESDAKIRSYLSTFLFVTDD
jgi:hypothetical protein